MPCIRTVSGSDGFHELSINEKMPKFEYVATCNFYCAVVSPISRNFFFKDIQIFKKYCVQVFALLIVVPDDGVGDIV
jgi:hypothetical protein